MVVDTACSSGLVAVTVAAEYLGSGTCASAIVGAANVILPGELHGHFNAAGMLSPDSRCKTFDASANGYVRSEGCAVVFLRSGSSESAESLDGSAPPHALLAACGANQDGKSGGITVPNKRAQQELVAQTLKRSGVSCVNVVEAHGTGTPLGDPIEVHALVNVLGLQELPLVLASVKSNLGHAEAVSGLIGLIKLVDGFRVDRMFRHLHFSTLNPQIGAHVLEVGCAVIPLKNIEGVEVAALNSFGFSGTNSHAVLERAPPSSIPLDSHHPTAMRSLVLWGKTAQAVMKLAANWSRHLMCSGKSSNSLATPLGSGGAHVWVYGRAIHHLADRLLLAAASNDERCMLSAGLVVVCPGAGWRAPRGLQRLVHGEFGISSLLLSRHLTTRGWFSKDGTVSPFGALAVSVCGLDALARWDVIVSAQFGWGVGVHVGEFRARTRRMEDVLQRVDRASAKMAALPDEWHALSAQLVVEMGRSAVGRRTKPEARWISAVQRQDVSLRVPLEYFGVCSVTEPLSSSAVVYPFSHDKCRLQERPARDNQLPLYSVEWSKKATEPSSCPAVVFGASPFLRRQFGVLHKLQVKAQASADVCMVWLAVEGPQQSAAECAWRLIDFVRRLLALKRGISMLIATKSAVRIAAHELELASQAAVWGVGCAIRVEHPQLNCVNVDSDDLMSLVQELNSRGTFECAYRDGVRYVPELVAQRSSAGSFSKRGLLYLVTGGFGGLGHVCLVWAASQAARSVALVGRGGASAEHMSTLQQPSFAAGVWCLPADCSKPGEGKVILQLDRWQGLCHLAGTASASLLSKSNARHVALCFEGKVGSLRFLGSEFAVVCLFSSQAAVIPIAGQGVYCAANCAMEAFAMGERCVAVQWGLVADVGMMHGAGTSLGGPIEVGALADSYGKTRYRQPLVLGSVKTNLGHTEGAAGATAVLKTLLQLAQAAIAPNLHLQTLNNYIGTPQMERMLAVVAHELVEWPQQGKVVGVSSFGFSGTNSHAILRRVAPRPPRVSLLPVELSLSGRTAESLRQLIQERCAAVIEATGSIERLLAARGPKWPVQVPFKTVNPKSLAQALTETQAVGGHVFGALLRAGVSTATPFKSPPSSFAWLHVSLYAFERKAFSVGPPSKLASAASDNGHFAREADVVLRLEARKCRQGSCYYRIGS